MFLGEIGYLIVVILHVLAVLVAVGAVTVTDYFHILGLRSKRIEKKLLFTFPRLSHMIIGALIATYITGILLVVNNTALLSSPHFQLKMFLVLVVTFNGYYLEKKVFPMLESCVMKGICPTTLLIKSSFAGSLSVVTWYAIVVLALSKNIGYAWWHFVIAYIIAFFIAFLGALFIEAKTRHWQ